VVDVRSKCFNDGAMLETFLNPLLGGVPRLSRKGSKATKKKMFPNLAFLASWRENNRKRL
jgi:hypothetical protein